MTNHYSAAWFRTFLPEGSPPAVHREISFLERHLPLPGYRRLLDVACGVGRHALALAEAGYEVLGIDVSDAALETARASIPASADPRPAFLLHDMRELDLLETGFDGVLCLWQSFGGFEDDENSAVLAAMARRLRNGGRLLLDVYHREALAALPAEETERRDDREILTRRELDGTRYRVRLAYSDTDEHDAFDWQVFTPEELTDEAAAVGLVPVVACAWFDSEVPPSPEHVRMQLLFERRGG